MRKVLSFPGSKVISVHDSDRSASKEGKDKGVHGCGFSAVRHESRPSLVAAPLKLLFPRQQLRFFTFEMLLLQKGIYPQRKINSRPRGSFRRVKDLWLVFYDSCPSIDLCHDYIPAVPDPRTRLDS